jgi:hypothetical protein
VEDGEPLAESVDLAHSPICLICLAGKEACEELGEFLAHNGAGHFFHKQCLSTALKQDTRCAGCRENGLSYYSVDKEGLDKHGKLLVSAAAEAVLGSIRKDRIGELENIIAEKDYDQFREVMEELTITIREKGLSPVDGKRLKAAFFQAISLGDVTLIEGFLDLFLLLKNNSNRHGIYAEPLAYSKELAIQLFNKAIIRGAKEGNFSLLSLLLEHQKRGFPLYERTQILALLHASSHGKRNLLELLLSGNSIYSGYLEEALQNAREEKNRTDETPGIINLLTKTLWQARIAELCNIIFLLWPLLIIPYVILEHLKSR